MINSNLIEPAYATPTTPVTPASNPASLRASQDALTSPSSLSSLPFQQSTKSYDYLLKVAIFLRFDVVNVREDGESECNAQCLQVLLVGDSDVGKQEILAGLDDGSTEWGSSYAASAAGGAGKIIHFLFILRLHVQLTLHMHPFAAFKETIILIDGKRVKLQLWDTSGQGRFCTIIRSYSRGAQGILLVYDITSKWSFEGIDRWRKEVDQVGMNSKSGRVSASSIHHRRSVEITHLITISIIILSSNLLPQHAPGIPKVLVGNRLHLAFRRQVAPSEAEEYAEKNSMGFFEVGPSLVNSDPQL